MDEYVPKPLCASGSVAEQFTLGAQGHDDASDFLQQHLKDSNSRFRACKFLILERYKQGEIALVLKVKFPLGAGVYDFIFLAIPVDNLRKLNSGEIEGRALNVEFKGAPNHERDQRVLAYVTEIIEGVERVIPSTVTVEQSKPRLDFRRQIFASTPHAILKIGGGISERKSDVSGIGMTSSSQVASKGCVIEGGSCMLDDFRREDTPSEWKSLGELDFVNIVDSVRVRLDNAGMWLFSEKLNNLGFEVVEMFLCAQDSNLGAVKDADRAGRLHDRQT
jgi:hypothetical protein